MRAMALALMLAVGPIGPTLCEFTCADAAALHGMAGMSPGSLHDMGDMSLGHEHASSTARAADLTFIGDSACTHFIRVLPSILRADGSASFLGVAAAEPAGALRVDFRALAFAVMSSASVSPPLHSPPRVPLRI